MRRLVLLLVAMSGAASAQHWKVAPTWLRRYVPDLREQSNDLTTPSCRYLPIFGEGDRESGAVQSLVRFGQLTVDAGGLCNSVQYPGQEQIYFVLEGEGSLDYSGERAPLRRNDFTYIAPTVRHTVSGSSGQPLRVIVMAFKIPARTFIAAPPARPVVANASEVREQTVEGHPTSVLYKLLVGPRTGTRDRINAAYVVADVFLMDFAAGGTNFPHHHQTAEEIYLVLDGEGQMVAGGGTDGIEGLHPAKAGDAYYFRPNCTVGFYNRNRPGAKAHILAVRAFVPLPGNPD